MAISVEAIKELRNITSASVMECKKALQESDGDLQKALAVLKKRGLELAAKKQERAAKEGRVECYVHTGNKLGVLLEVDCETDFVARNPDFCQFTKDLAMQIAACSPLYIKREDVPEEVLSREKDKEAFYKECCLLEQMFIKDASLTIKDCLNSLITKMGENVVVRKFARYKIGE